MFHSYTSMLSVCLLVFTSSLSNAAILTHGPVAGGATANSIKIFIRTDQSAVIDIAYSTSQNLTPYSLSSTSTTVSDNDFTKIFDLASLSPDTTYYYTPRIDGIPALTYPYPSFKIFPAVNTAEFAFLVLTDFSDHLRPQWGNGPAIRAAGREQAVFALIGGDFPHAERQTLADKRDIYKQMYDCTKSALDLCMSIFRRMPLYHIWDDHDMGTNDADKTYVNKSLSLQVYKEYLPSPPLANPEAGIWHSFRYAQAEFFLLDGRYQRDPNKNLDGPDKSMLDGDNLGVTGQLQWLEDSLKHSTARWKFIMSSSVFNPSTKGPPDAPDSWGAFRNEHDELVDYIKNNQIHGVIVLSGDIHTGGAFDDGTNSGLIELNIPHANLSPCFADTFVGVFGNWTYMLTGYGNPGYGLIQVKTNPDRVILNLKSYDSSLRKAWVIDENGITAVDGPFQPIKDLGYFIWNDAAHQKWGICWRGDQSEHHFDGEITSDGTFENIRAFGLENSDSVSWDSSPSSFIKFDASAIGDEDGVLFQATGDTIIFDVKQDEEYHPEFITTGLDTLVPGIWSRFQHDGLHIGQSVYRGPQNPNLKWQYQSTQRIYSSPAQASDGTLYMADLDGVLRAFDQHGTVKWEFKTGGQIFSSPCIGPDGTIYFGSADNFVYAISSDGTQKWSFKTGGPVRSSPNMTHERASLVFGSNDGYLYNIDLNGNIKWKFYSGAAITGSPAISFDGLIYIGSGDKLYALYPDGALYWTFKTNDRIGSSPSIDLQDGSVYIGSWDGGLYSLTREGKLKWKVQTGGRIQSSAAIGFDQTVYVGSIDENLYAINSNGEIKWKFLASGCSDCVCHIAPPQDPNCNEIESSPTIDLDGTIYVGSHDNFLYAISPDGMLKWRFQAGDWINSSAAIGSDGTIYFGSRDKKFYAIGP